MDEYKCGDCFHANLCEKSKMLVGFSRDNPAYCGMFLNSADVAPVKHAKVIDKISDDHETIKPWDYRYYCSACKIPMRDSWNKYCPNCGAKMDGECDA